MERFCFVFPSLTLPQQPNEKTLFIVFVSNSISKDSQEKRKYLQNTEGNGAFLFYFPYCLMLPQQPSCVLMAKEHCLLYFYLIQFSKILKKRENICKIQKVMECFCFVFPSLMLPQQPSRVLMANKTLFIVFVSNIHFQRFTTKEKISPKIQKNT